MDGSAGETGSVSGAVGNESKVKFGEGEVLLLESWRTGLARALPYAHTGAEMTNQTTTTIKPRMFRASTSILDTS